MAATLPPRSIDILVLKAKQTKINLFVDVDAIIEDLFPDDIVELVIFGDVDYLLNPDLLQFGIAGYVLLLHPCSNVRVRLPTVKADFVTAQVQILILEHAAQFTPRLINELIVRLVRHIGWPVVPIELAIWSAALSQ